MLKVLYFLFFALFFFSSPLITAQEIIKCSFDEEYSKLMKDSNYKERHEQMENQIRAFIQERQKKKSPTDISYIVPVVIHIITPLGTPIGTGNNLTNEEIEYGLDLLNQSFSNTGAFQTPDGQDIGIQFCLAKRTPNGQATNGITRHESELVNDTYCNEPSTNNQNNSSIKQIVNWNCKDYLNIWLVTNLYSESLGCGLAGFAYFPGAPCSIDGIMQESRYWTTVEGTQVTAHEVGHYFNLHHTFHNGCKNDDCTIDGDRVCDTPPDSSPSFAPCNTNSCNTDSPDIPDDNTNYMDYTSCKPLHFTQGQKERMIAGLEIGRSSLLSSLGCQPNVSIDAQVLFDGNISISCGEEYCPDIKIKNVGINSLNEIILDIYVDDEKKDSFTWTGNLDLGESQSIQLPCISLEQGTHTSFVQISSVNNDIDLNSSNDTSKIVFFEILEKPVISLLGIDSTRCGFNGAIYVNTDKGKEPYRYRLLPATTFQNSPIFSNLKNEEYSIEVSDASDCKDTLVYTIPDLCPPCVSGIINKYAAVENICENTFTVDSLVGFSEGSKVLIYQAQGAKVNLSNTSAFGKVTDFGNAGNYEYNVIESIEGLDVTFRYQLENSYDIQGNPQLITVPNLGNETICNLTCSTWNGRKGGILVFDADTIEMVGNIDVSGKGFRGGIVKKNADFIKPSVADYFVENERYGGLKGESIAISKEGYLYGRGKFANGGGGGNTVNAGGGGGGNLSSGGQGGTYIFYPTNTLGLGGKIELNSPNKLFFGGGGGAGHDNDSKGTNGAFGGGVILIHTNQLIADYPILIQSNGLNAITAGYDGSGGGGGGGSIVIDAFKLDQKIEVLVRGGKGGDNHSGYYNTCHGTGGGGGGGVLYSNLPIINYNLMGGDRGLIINSYDIPNCATQPSGGHATAGEDGEFVNDLFIDIADKLFVMPSFQFINTSLLCSGEVQILASANKGSVDNIQFELSGSTQINDSTFVVSNQGWHTLSLVSNCIRKDTLIYVDTIEPIDLEIDAIQAQTCNSLGYIISHGEHGDSPYYYKINSQDWQSSGTFKDLLPGNYYLAVKDAKGCETFKEVTIHNQSSPLQIEIDSSNLSLDCTDKVLYIALSTIGSDPLHYYSLDGSEEVTNPYFSDLTLGKHEVISKDEFGCISKILKFEVIDNRIESLQEQYMTICNGEQLMVGNSTYTTEGIYIDTLMNVFGCDSVIETHLSVFDNSSQNIEKIICKNENYNFYGTIINSSGSYEHILEAYNGCDSVITLNLQVTPEKIENNNVSLCEGAKYVVGSSEYSVSGTYIDSLKSYKNCDSIIISTLYFWPRYENDYNILLCEGDSIIVGDSKYTKEGIYSDTLLSLQGCDSIIHTSIEIGQPYSEEIDVELCYGETYDSGQQIYDASGEYTEIRPAQMGCDSTLNIRLNILDQSTSSTSYTLCEGDTLEVDGQLYTEFGNFENILVDLNGCDSLAYVDIRRENENYCDSINCAVYIPNAFTPDGNGINDMFEIPNIYLDITEFSIFDRWGNRVYQTVSNEPIKWDGRFKGKDAMPGVYIYLLTGRCRTGKSIKIVGDLTLIR